MMIKIFATVSHVDGIDFPIATFHSSFERAEAYLHEEARLMEEHGDTGAVEIRALEVEPPLVPAAYCELANGAERESILLAIPHRVVQRYSVGGCGAVKLES